MLKLALVNAVKQADGSFVKPNIADFDSVDKLNAIATDEKPSNVVPKGYAGEQFSAGELYAGNFDTESNHFASGSDLVPVPADKLPGDVTPKHLKANSDGSISDE